MSESTAMFAVLDAPAPTTPATIRCRCCGKLIGDMSPDGRALVINSIKFIGTTRFVCVCGVSRLFRPMPGR